MLDGMVREMLDSSLKYANDQVSSAIGGQTKEYLNMSLQIEKYVDGLLSTNSFEKIYATATAIAIVLILLVFLKKGFDTYVLWREGDPELSPVRLLERAGIAVVILFLFNPFYDVAVDVSKNIYSDVFFKGVGKIVDARDDLYEKEVLKQEEQNIKIFIRQSHTRAEVHERLAKRETWKNNEQALKNILDPSVISDARWEEMKKTLVSLDKSEFFSKFEILTALQGNPFAALMASIIEFFVWYQMLKVGVQILILRLIAPFVLINLLSANPTLYLSYIGILGKSIAAVVLQLFAFLLGYNLAHGGGGLWVGILIMASSLRVPALIMSLTTNLGTGGEAGSVSRSLYGLGRMGGGIARTVRLWKKGA